MQAATSTIDFHRTNTLHDCTIAYSSHREISSIIPRLKSEVPVLLICDREEDNLISVATFAETFPQAIKLSGVLEMGVEIDRCFIPLAQSLGLNIRVFPSKFDPGSEAEIEMPHFEFPDCSLTRTTKGEDRLDVEVEVTNIAHLPYKAELLRTDPSFRQRLCEEIFLRIQEVGPKIVFLANFKVVLHKQLVERLAENKITCINVHPSVLPELQGNRPEHKAANLNMWPYANGCTFHIVTAGLDEGGVIAQISVDLPPHLPEEERGAIEPQKYAEMREDANRRSIVQAQAYWTPLILSLWGTLAEEQKKVVHDREAFAAEGREGHERSEGYLTYLREGFEQWAKKSGREKEIAGDQQMPITEWLEANSNLFNEWHQNIRVPYARYLVDIGNGFQTVEDILGMPKEPIKATLLEVPRYFQFSIPNEDEKAMAKYTNLVYRDFEAAGGEISSSKFTQLTVYGHKIGLCEVVTTKGDLLALLRERKIEVLASRDFPIRTLAARQKMFFHDPLI